MYFRFSVAIAFVVLISMFGMNIEKQNRGLRDEMISLRNEQQQLAYQISEERQAATQLGISERKLNALEEGTIALPSPKNPSRLVQGQDSSVH